MLNVKIDPASKAEIEAAARLLGVSVSEFVRGELRAAVARVRKTKSPGPWALLKPYSGKYETPDAALSARSPSQLIRDRYRAKRAG
jgi:Ribbon-helix-helix protein, copG family